MRGRGTVIARRVAGTLAGAVVANLFIFGWEWALPLMPFGRVVAGVDPAAAGSIAAIPLPALLWVAAGWALGSALGAVAAFAAARWDYAGFVVAALIAAAGIANVLLIAHPLWMRLWAVAGPFVGATLAFGLYRRWRAARLHLRR